MKNPDPRSAAVPPRDAHLKIVQPGRLARAAASAALAALAAVVCTTARAQDDAAVTELRQQILQMKQSYETRIRALETRIDALEKRRAGTVLPAAPAPVSAAQENEIEALRAAARRAAGTADQPAHTAEDTTAQSPAIGHERNLNRLNPEISLTGDLVARYAFPEATFDAREFELDAQAALDPFSTAKWTLSFGHGEVDVEEGYVNYHGLPGGVALRAGRMRQTFGALNRFHQHALPQIDYPLALRRFFGAEGLDQTGLSLEWLVPRPWASANELTLQITDGAGEAFGGGNFERLVALGHLKNYWDLNDSTYFEWGLSGVGGRSAPGRESAVVGSDLTLHWQPPARAKYREVTWRSEGLLSLRDDPGGALREAWGAYSYVEGLLRRNLYAGLRYDWAERPLDPGADQWRVSPYLTWWQSEFVRLRGAYELVHDGPSHDTTHRLLLQLTWAAGPHKHENY